MKKIFTIVLMLLTLMAPRIGYTQQYLTVHDGTDTSEYIPVYGFFVDDYLKMEMVYPAQELSVMNGANLTGMSFYAEESSSDWGNPTFRVFLAEVSSPTVSAFVGSGTVVFEGTLEISGGVMTVLFDQPFTYHGGNLLVGIYDILPGDDFSDSHWYGEAVNGAAILGLANNEEADFPMDFLPKTTFQYIPAGVSSCLRPTNLMASNVSAHSVTLGWTENGSASSWQICLNEDEDNLITVTSNPYTLTGLTAGTDYSVKVRSRCNNGATTSTWSNAISFLATDDVVIGYGASSSNNLPSTSFYKYSLTQQIYTAGEIGMAGTINSVAFYNQGSEKTRNYDMYIVHTPKTSFASNNDWIPVTASDRVFSGEVTMAANAWTVIQIDGFDYNGTSNLALVMDDNTNSWSEGMSCRVFSAASQAILVYADDTNYDPCGSLGYSGTVANMKNQIVLGITPAGMVACARPATFSVNNITAHSAVLSWSGGSGTYNVEYKKDADEVWSVYANGVTSTSLNMNNLSQATQYAVRIQSVCPDSVSGWKSTFFTTQVACTDHIYVTENGTGDGSSWALAMSDLQSALSTALDIRNAYGLTLDVWVANGTYYGDMTGINAFTMVEGVNVYGGFAGNEPASYNLLLRNFNTHATILDGASSRRVLYQPTDFNTLTTWDGFTIQHGQMATDGAGAFLREGSRLSNCKILDNVSLSGDGGGVYCDDHAVLENCDFERNTAYYSGGGVYAYRSTVRNCRMANNTANRGGGVYLSYQSNLVSSRISHNQAYEGGGIYMLSLSQVRNCLVDNNTADASSYSLGGGGICCASTGAVVNTTVVRNASTDGGAGVSGQGGASLTNCIVWGNEQDGNPSNVVGNLAVSFSAVEGGCPGDSIIVLNDVNPPLFVNSSATAGASDNSSGADWHFQNGSPCANAGNNAAVTDSLDLDGTARVKRDTVDLGCYESNFYSVPVSYCVTVYHEFSDTACVNYTWNDRTYYWSGDYTQTMELPNGCDSVVTLHLTINRSVSTYESLSICESELPYTYLDTVFDVGTPQNSYFTFRLMADNGCDSVIHLHLTVQPSILGAFGAMTPTNNYTVTNQAVHFTWDAVENATGYALYVWPVGDPQPQQPAVSQDYWTQCVVTNLQNRRDYQWFLKAYSACDTTVSAVRQFTLNVAPVLTVNSGAIMDFGEIPLDSTRSRYFQVTGTALTSAISYQLSGTDASSFSLSPSSSWNSMTGGGMQISFHPTVPQNEYVAQITIQSDTLVRTFTVKGCLSGFLTFTTTVDADVYATDSEIPIHGQVTNLLNDPVAGLDVEVYVKVFDLVRTIPATTDANGLFEVSFVPQQSESGYYTVGARRLGADGMAVHDAFNIPGMMLLSSDWILWKPNTAQADTGTIAVRNRSQVPLTNIQVTPASLPNGCTVQFEPLNLAGLATGELQYVVSGSVASTGVNYEEVRLNAFSDEGAAMNFSAWYYCMQQRADLDVMPLSLTNTMNRGKSKVVDFKIFNNGNGPTGNIYVTLPDVPWMSVVGSDTLPSLGVHDSAYVSIRLSADSTTALIRYTGNIAINCERGEGVSIPYSITAISDSTGALMVDVTDDYTYNTNSGNGPHLAGADVIVKGYYSLETVATGVTDSNGVFVADNLPEGWYKLIIRADRHDEYQNNLYITAGETNHQDIFIQFQAITYSWEVVPTEIGDEYTYELVVNYETHVPTPVIVLEMPSELPALQEGESYTFDYVLTNHGLIAAFDVQLFAPQSSLYTFTPLYDQMDSLPAQTSVSIPCVMSRPVQTRSANNAAGLRYGSDGDCPHLIRTSVVGYKLCGGDRYPIWAYKMVTDGTYEPCPTWTSMPMYYGGIAGGTSVLAGNYSSEPLTTPVAICECEDEVVSYDTTLTNKLDTLFFVFIKNLRNCVTGELYQIRDTVPILDEDCEVTVTVNPFNRPLSGVGRIGVAADGASKMYIYVKSNCQLLSSQLLWSLTYNHTTDSTIVGSISPEIVQVNDTMLMMTYIAPSEFPANVDKAYEVTLTVMMIVGDGGEGTDVFNVVFPISIVRPPVLLIHGLGSDAGCFADLYDILKSQYYDEWQLKKVDYHSTNSDYFSENEGVVQRNLNDIFSLYREHGYAVSKADLVGHSMGGILSRLHVEYVDSSNIHKVITVNTPHSGAHIADIVIGNKYLSSAARVKFKMGKFTENIWDWTIGAVEDLRVTSSAIRTYLNSRARLDRMNNIPVHAIVSTVNTGAPNLIDAELKSDIIFELKLCSMLCPNDTIRHLADDLLRGAALSEAAVDALFCGLQKVLHNYVFHEESDYVVPLRSQQGGLPANNVTLFDNNVAETSHVGITSYGPAMNRIIELLKAPTTSDLFCMTGFRPDTLPYPSVGPEESYSECVLNLMLSLNQTASLHEATHPSGLSGRGAAVNSRSGQSSASLAAEYNDANRTITATCNYSEDVGNRLVMACLSDGRTLLAFMDTAQIEIPATYKGPVKVFAVGEIDGGNVVTDSVTVQIGQYGTTPQSIHFVNDTLYILENDTILPMVECVWTTGDITYVTPVFQANDSVLYAANDLVVGRNEGTSGLVAHFEGLTTTAPVSVYGLRLDNDDFYNDQGGGGTGGNENDTLSHSGVCASITVQFSQKMTMTREAFEGTLTINNGHDSDPMQDIDVEFVIRDEAGVDCTNLFQINFLSYNNMTGSNGSASLAAQNEGSIVVQFIPTKQAAPEIAKVYSFGGSFSFLDPFSGESVTYNLFSVDITVHPSPDLYVNYFMQRDILGDDPLTEDRVEPMVPAELGVIIHNRGAGVAKNVVLETAEPQIVDNDKGLAVDFAMCGASFNGSERQLGLMEIPFGNIEPHHAGVGEWWFTSTLLGHFISYEAHVIHNNSFGDPNLSLVSSLDIHPLIHTIYAYGNLDDGINDFLVDDVEDNLNYPDSLYFSDGSRTGVATADSISFDHYVTPEDTVVILTLDPSRIGWNYEQTWDPGQGQYELLSCTRNSDQQLIPLSNVWQTFVTLPVGADPVYENKLHIVDTLDNDLPTTYTLVFGIKVQVLEVDTILDVPNNIVTAPLSEVTVKFNKPIVDSTFDYQDMSLKCNNGQNLFDGNLIVERIDSMTYKLHLEPYTQLSGYYVLNIHTQNITDVSGFNGFYGKQAVWTQNIACDADSTSITATACDSYTWNGSIYDHSGVFEQHFTNVDGCDSVVTLTLTILHGDYTETAVSSCDAGYYWALEGITLTQPGTYYHYSTNANGCTDTAALVLSLYLPATTEIMAQICEGEVYNQNGFNVSTAGDHQLNLQTVHGCDSTVILHLAIGNEHVMYYAASICEGETFSDYGFDITAPTAGTHVYSDTVVRPGTCDSVVVLTLTVNAITYGDTTVVANGSFDWYEYTNLTQSGDYTHTFTNAAGCDSVVTLHLTVNVTIYTEFTDAACDSYVWNNVTYTASGDYIQSFTVANGCDSIVTLHLTIFESPAVQAISGETELCQNQYATYYYDVSDPNYQYKWFKDNVLWSTDVPAMTLHELTSGTVLLTMQVTDTQYGCAADTSLSVQVVNRIAPDTTEVRLMANSNILVCQPVNSQYGEVHYRWGYTDRMTSAEVIMPGDHNYCLYDFGIDTLSFHYWVETYLNSAVGEGCDNRSYYGHGNVMTFTPDYGDNVVEAYLSNDRIVLYVNALSSDHVTAAVYDVNGKLLVTKGYGITNQVSDMIPVSMAPGVYFLRVSIGRQHYSVKLLKI